MASLIMVKHVVGNPKYLPVTGTLLHFFAVLWRRLVAKIRKQVLVGGPLNDHYRTRR
jgi:hypothetical protein